MRANRSTDPTHGIEGPADSIGLCTVPSCPLHGLRDTRSADALARLCKPMLQYGGATYNPYLWAMFCVSERRRVAENASDANSERGTQQCSLESAAAALGYFCRSY